MRDSKYESQAADEAARRFIEMQRVIKEEQDKPTEITITTELGLDKFFVKCYSSVAEIWS